MQALKVKHVSGRFVKQEQLKERRRAKRKLQCLGSSTGGECIHKSCNLVQFWTENCQWRSKEFSTRGA